MDNTLKTIVLLVISVLLMSGCSTVLDPDYGLHTSDSSAILLGTWVNEAGVELEVDIVDGIVKVFVYSGGYYEYELEYLGIAVEDTYVFHNAALTTLYSPNEDAVVAMAYGYPENDTNRLLVGLTFFDEAGVEITHSIVEFERDTLPVVGNPL